jgi:hypothetical protein
MHAADEFAVATVSSNVLHGAPAPPGLAEWLARARSVAASQQSQTARQRYVAWAMRQVQHYASQAHVDWRRVELLPANAPTPGTAAAPAYEQHRAARLREVCTNRFRQIYASSPSSLPAALQALDAELRRLDTAFQNGSLRSYFLLASEAVVAQVLRPHPLPPMPPSLAAQQLFVDSPPAAAPPTYTAPPPAPVAAARSGPPAAYAPSQPGAQLQRQPYNNGQARPTSQNEFGGRAVVEAPRKPVRVPVLTAQVVAGRMRQFFGAATGSAVSPTATGGRHFNGNAARGGRFVGESSALERRYTREEPRADDIRPRHVLPQALQHVYRRYEAMRSGDLEAFGATKAAVGQNPEWEAARWLSEQLKGMRQDIKVQGLQDPFTVAVYEVHARVCLMTGDPLEFNSCQAALHHFYQVGLLSDPSAADVDAAVSKSPSGGQTRSGQAAAVEFSAYRMLYATLHGLYSAVAHEQEHQAATCEASFALGNAVTAQELAAATPRQFVLNQRIRYERMFEMEQRPDAKTTEKGRKDLQPAAKAAQARANAWGSGCLVRRASLDVVADNEEDASLPSWAHEDVFSEPRDARLSTAALASLALTPEMRRVELLCSSADLSSGPLFVAALTRMAEDARCVDVMPGVAGLVAAALQRLRMQWLYSVLYNGARGTATAEFVAAWLGFPVLDDFCRTHVLGHVNTGAGLQSAADAWNDLWKTLKLAPDAAPGWPFTEKEPGGRVLRGIPSQSSSSAAARRAPPKANAGKKKPVSKRSKPNELVVVSEFNPEHGPVSAVPPNTSTAGKGSTVDVAAVGAAVLQYRKFLGSGSSGATATGDSN